MKVPLFVDYSQVHLTSPNKVQLPLLFSSKKRPGIYTLSIDDTETGEGTLNIPGTTPLRLLAKHPALGESLINVLRANSATNPPASSSLRPTSF